MLSTSFTLTGLAEKPDPPTDLELTDQMERSVQLTWIPGDENNSPIQSTKYWLTDSFIHSVLHFDVRFELVTNEKT